MKMLKTILIYIQKILSPNGIVSIHDTDESYEKDYIVTDDIEKDFDDVTNGASKLVKELKKEDWEILIFSIMEYLKVNQVLRV